MRLLALCLVVLISACAKPTTRAPKLDPNEVAAEQAAQQAMVQEQGVVEGKKIRVSGKEVETRMDRTAPAVLKAGQKLCMDMGGAQGECSFRFRIENKDVINAYADGKMVVVTPQIVGLTQTQEELAMVLAHEYAHNILRHPQGTGMNATGGAILGAVLDSVAGSQGISTGGAFSQLGGQMAVYQYSVAFEKEADYVGLYILARAGYDMDRGIGIWRRLTMTDPEGIYTSATHPGNAERVVAMRKTIAEIKAKKAAGQPLIPEMRRD